MYSLGYVKLLVTICKYIPQAWKNYRQQSTEGWSIWPILMDCAGGILSIAQLFIDSSMQSDWSGVFGNPIKLMLGNISIVFDGLFIWQHYVLYRKTNRRKMSDSEMDEQTLLTDDHHARNSRVTDKSYS